VIVRIRIDRKIMKAAIGIVALILVLPHAVVLSAQVASVTLPDAPAPNLMAFDGQTKQQSPIQTTPPATSSSSQQTPTKSGAPPSLGDLGLTPEEVQGNAQTQAMLDKRTHMLKVHQRLGLLTTIPLAAALFASAGAPCNRNCSNTAGTDFHAALGSVAVGMYAATAYYAIAAPRIPGTQKKGAIRWHEALIWIHGPGIILTPILGAMALSQQNDGQKVHGIASAHSAVAVTTIAAYGASIIAVSWPIHVKFWEHQ
jgi:hypothetical protein